MNDPNMVIRKEQPVFYFIGVTTSQSAMVKIFPEWVSALGRPEVVMEGVDLKIHDHPENYRRAVALIKYDPLSLGALVTTHKIDLFEACKDLFDVLDPFAQTMGEVTGISKGPDGLYGHAVDAVSCGLSIDRLLGEDYFGKSGGDVLCFGAGGAATAALWHLAHKASPSDRPTRFIVVDRQLDRLIRLQGIMAEVPIANGESRDMEIAYVLNDDPHENDKLLADLPKGSLVINATGMGKDTPGSPISPTGVFPRDGLAWDFNYRGELDFLRQALAQQKERGLRVEDGWTYFLFGWTIVIGHVLHLEIDTAQFQKIAQIAAKYAPRRLLSA